MPVSPGRPSYQIAGGQSESQPGEVSGFLTPVSEQTSGLPEKIKDFDNGGETLGGQQKKRFSEVNQAAKEAFLREANRFPAGSLPIEPERTKTEYFDRYGTLSREPNSASGLESFILDIAIQSIIETGTAIYQTGLYLFDSVVILGEGGITGLTYLYGGTENAYQHRYSPKSIVYNQLFSGKITTGQAILMVEMNYGVTVLTLSPLAKISRIPKPGAGPVPGSSPSLNVFSQVEKRFASSSTPINPKIYIQLERQLANPSAGPKSIFKALRSAEDSLAEHIARLPELKYKSQVESTIRNVESQIETIKKFIQDKGLVK